MKKIYNATESPIKVFGLPLVYEMGEWRRLPKELANAVPTISLYEKIVTGGRIGFSTNAPEFTLRCKVKMQQPNERTSWLFGTGFNVYAGERPTSRYLGYLSLSENKFDWVTIEKTFKKGSGEFEDIIIFLSQMCYVESCEIIVDKGAEIKEPTPYKYSKPIVFYGSSITSGEASSRAATSYIALLSRWLDADYINFGFPGRARGDIEVAEYIKNIDMSVFVYDYDHNAETPEDLRRTHKPFFEVIRKQNPELPIIMMTRPCGDAKDVAERRKIVYETYEGAKAAGDENVYFINGEEMFGTEERHACTIDLIHPNDLGCMRMAKYILPTLKKALGEK